MSRIAVMVSGGGSNLQALLDDVDLFPHIALVLSDRPAGALERAACRGVETLELSRKDLGKARLSQKIDKIMKDREIDLIILAGYLSIFTEEFSAAWRGRMINIHPSLLPRHGGVGMYGMRVHEAVIKSGDAESGCTVHFVGEGVDKGEIIMQERVPVFQGDKPEDLQRRVLEKEHILLPKAVRTLI